jgi:hypothetical protein
MLLTDTPWWSKLFDKGVDITAAVLCALAVSTVLGMRALIFRSRKEKRDLKRSAEEHRQKLQIDNENAQIKEAAAKQHKIAGLSRDAQEQIAFLKRNGTSEHNRVIRAHVDELIAVLRQLEDEEVDTNSERFREWWSANSGRLPIAVNIVNPSMRSELLQVLSELRIVDC